MGPSSTTQVEPACPPLERSFEAVELPMHFAYGVDVMRHREKSAVASLTNVPFASAPPQS